MKNDLFYVDMIEDMFKNMRHDYLNEIQIIYGYMRLNKIDKAIEYIDKIKEDSIVSSKLSRLGCVFLYMVLVNCLKKSNDYGLDIDFEVFSISTKEDFVEQDISSELNNFELAFCKVLDYMYKNNIFEKHIFYIEETKDIFSFKIDFDKLDEENLKSFLDVENFIIEENSLIYEIELKGD